MRGKMRSAKALMELCTRLSHDGKFQVMFVSDPTRPEVFEFFTVSEPLTRYVNLCARPGAKISQVLPSS